MKSKFLFIVLTIFGLLSVFSVGFSSWILTKPMDTYEEDNVMNTIVYEAYDNAKYLHINSFTTLQYYNTGFVKNNVEITNLVANGTPRTSSPTSKFRISS